MKKIDKEATMELHSVETFLKVAASQNLSRSAEQLGYSQSAVSVHQ